MAMTVLTTRPYLLASETPMLRDEKNLCPFLKKMDEEELPFLDHDLKEEQTRMEAWKRGPVKNGIIAGIIGAICAIAAAIFFSNSRKKNEGTRHNWDTTNQMRGDVSGLTAMLAFISSIVGPFYAKAEMEYQLHSDIIGERICRIKNKIRQIDGALQENSSEINKSQLLKVKDHFDLRLQEMILKKTNIINIKVTKC